MKRIVFILIIFMSYSNIYANHKTAHISFDINSKKNGFASDKLFGVFIEFLEDYVNGPGGLWAQEFIDRGFDSDWHENNLYGFHWKDSSRFAGLPALIRGGYNPNGRFYKNLVSDNESGYTSTYQKILYCDSIEHTIYFYYKGIIEFGSLKVIVSDTLNQTRLFEYVLPQSTNQWTKRTFKLPALKGYTKLNIHFALEGKGNIDLDEVSCVPDNNVLGVRKEWFDLIKAMKPGIFRYPGGCFADHPFSDFWKGIGDIDKRFAPNYAPNSGFQRMDFGSLEFMELCKLLNTEPLLVVNYQTNDSENAMNWIQYLTADTLNYWGKLRASHGISKPYKVKYIEVGNEQWDNNKVYGKKYIEYYDKLKKYDSNFVITINGNHWGGQEYFDTVAKYSEYYGDLHSYHPVTAYDTRYVHEFEDIYNSLVFGSCLDVDINLYDNHIKRNYKQNNQKQCISEWWTHYADSDGWLKDTSVVQGSFMFALANASFGISFLRNAELIEFSARTLGFNLIRRTTDSKGKRAIFAQPSHIALSLISNNFGRYVVPANIITERRWQTNSKIGLVYYQNVNVLDAVVTHSDDSVYVVVMNRDLRDSILTHFDFNYDFKYPAKVYTLYNDDVLDLVTADEPKKVQVKQHIQTFPRSYVFPPHSLTVFAFPFNTPSSVDDEKAENFAYPNPATSVVNIDLDDFENESVEVNIYDTNGKLFQQISQLVNGRLSLNVENLSRGTYIIEIRVNSVSKQFVFSKQ